MESVPGFVLANDIFHPHVQERKQFLLMSFVHLNAIIVMDDCKRKGGGVIFSLQEMGGEKVRMQGGKKLFSGAPTSIGLN